MRVHLFLSFVFVLRLSFYFWLLGGCKFTTKTHNTNHNKAFGIFFKVFFINFHTQNTQSFLFFSHSSVCVQVRVNVLFGKALTTTFKQTKCALPRNDVIFDRCRTKKNYYGFNLILTWNNHKCVWTMSVYALINFCVFAVSRVHGRCCIFNV